MTGVSRLAALAPLHLAAAKLSVPRPATTPVDRPRVVEVLVREAVLVALVAPAGFGKSTVAAQMADRLAAEGAGVGWVSLDAGDSDPRRFWAYVLEATAAAGVLGLEPAADLLVARPDADDAVTGAVDAWRAAVEAADRPVVLVLDDVHELTRDDGLRRLGAVLLSPPPTLRVVAASRVPLPLPVARLRGRGETVEVGPRALALDRTEIAAVLAAGSRPGAGPVDAVEVLRRTEGWPAAVRLMSLAGSALHAVTASPAAVDGDGGLADYLTSEVVAGLDPGVRDMLEVTSVSPLVTAELVEHLTGRDDGAELLERATAADLLISRIGVPPDAHCYRVHPLVREHLLTAFAARDPGRVRLLHERAGLFFAAHDRPDAAIRQFAAAQRVDLARDLIEQRWLEVTNDHGFLQLADWVDLLEAATDDDHGVGPLLSMIVAWGLLNRGLFDEAEHRLVRAVARFTGTSHDAFVRAHAETVRAHLARHRGDPATAAEHARRATALAGEVGKADGGILLAAGSAALGSALVWLDPDAARDVLVDALAHAAASDERSATVAATQYLALTEIDAGDRVTARRRAAEALAATEDPAAERFHKPSVAHLVVGLAGVEDGRPRDALISLDTALRLATEGREPLVLVRVHVARALAFHLLGEREDMSAELRSAERVLSTVLPGTDHGAGDGTPLHCLVRAAVARCRFVPRDGRHLPVGARELSEREMSVLRLAARGLARRDIAAQLYVSENTVKTHLVSIRRKIEAPGTTDLGVRARELGLLEA